MTRFYRYACAWMLASLLAACHPADDAEVEGGAQTPQAAEAFVRQSERQLSELLQKNERIAWLSSTFITADTERLAASVSSEFTALRVQLAVQAADYYAFDGIDADTRRKLHILRSAITVPAPRDVDKTLELSTIRTSLASLYGKGEYCYTGDACLDLGQLNDIMAESRDPEVLLDAWEGWRTVSPPMKDLYARQVELANEGATELGFSDLGQMWRSVYDMPPAEFSAELDRLWGEVKPLYEALHCHVRARLVEEYGSALVSPDGPMPAHLFGNMWAQDWSNIYPLVAPRETAFPYDLDATLKQRDFDAVTMVRMGEAFFSSLGFEELPATFWQRSMFVKPRDRDVVCHASAWNIDGQDDVRIKMCIKASAEDFKSIHHELGHNYYQRAYKGQSHLYRAGANDSFHEAIGDTVALSITPGYLQKIGLLEDIPDASGDIPLLLKRALEGVAFIPFGLLVDQWRWQVFAGDAGPDDYNDLWWQLREKYQGVKAPHERPAEAFDAGAKYHVPRNTPFTRYFLARFLQYQFHRSLCQIAGDEGPVHRCSIYASREAGEHLLTLLETGRSKPWQNQLEALTGQREIDATAMLDYFAPLKDWLDEQNQGRQCGW